MIKKTSKRTTVETMQKWGLAAGAVLGIVSLWLMEANAEPVVYVPVVLAAMSTVDAVLISVMTMPPEMGADESESSRGNRRVEMIWIDPREIVLSDSLWAINRDGVDELAASIKSVGLLQPPTAYRNDIGEVVALIGRRRVMASIIAGLPLIPVVMLPPQSGAACLAVQVVDDTSRAVKPREQLAGGVSAMMALGFSRGDLLGILGCPDPKEPGRLIRKSRSMASA